MKFRRLLKKTIRTSRVIKEYRDHHLHHKLHDEKHRKGSLPDPFELEAENLVTEIMERLKFLIPVAKKSPFNGCVAMKVGIYSDEQHELDEWANQLGFRSWKVAVLVYYALKLEDEMKCRKRL